MKITAYQANANILKEAQKVIHQQNLKELQVLNRQIEEHHKKQIARQWIKPNSVDVYA